MSPAIIIDHELGERFDYLDIGANELSEIVDAAGLHPRDANEMSLLLAGDTLYKSLHPTKPDNLFVSAMSKADQLPADSKFASQLEPDSALLSINVSKLVAPRTGKGIYENIIPDHSRGVVSEDGIVDLAALSDRIRRSVAGQLRSYQYSSELSKVFSLPNPAEKGSARLGSLMIFTGSVSLLMYGLGRADVIDFYDWKSAAISGALIVGGLVCVGSAAKDEIEFMNLVNSEASAFQEEIMDKKIGLNLVSAKVKY